MSTLPTSGSPASSDPVTYRAGTLKYTRLGLMQMLVWLLWGDFIFTLMERVLPSVMALLLKDLGASDMTIQLLSRTVSSVLVFCMSPIVSFSSDRHRGRYGRRMPYMLWTTPFVAVCLILLGFYKDISLWLVGSDNTFFGMDIATMYIFTFGVLIIAFDVFNVFVNDVWFYLFNDVVPPQFFVRFQAIFRMVGTGASAVYSFFIFPNILAEWQWFDGVDNFKVVLVGAGIMYGVGFMLMCYMVKEGKYPKPTPINDGKKGTLEAAGLGALGRRFDNVVASIKIYTKECFTHRFYWYFFLWNMSLTMTGAIGTFVILRNIKSLGISMAQMGSLWGITSIVSIFLMYPAGWIADKFHPVRVYYVLFIVSISKSVLEGVWIFWDFGPMGNFYYMIILSFGFMPFYAVRDLAAGPMQMMLLPKERYGQFCSANGMFRSLVMIGGSIVGALFMGVFSDGNDLLGVDSMGINAYRMWPVWDLIWMLIAFVFLTLLYREWKKRGGMNGFTPPAVGEK
ncbi:MAG: MFS transporter [Planctomycetaceae bacterium]|nr:MAG: MFS transporter [Planctomycetaceae bacterium]